MSDQRAMLDSCTSSPDCRGDFHLLCCPSTSREVPACPYCGERGGHQISCRNAGSDSLPVAPEVQRWERRQVGVDMGLHLEVDAQGRVTIHEAVLAQLLVDAGWERTA